METELQASFGKVLKHHRTAKGWSQMKLAAEAELHLNAYGKIERGEQFPTLHTIKKLSDALGVKMSDLILDLESKMQKQA